MKSINKLFLIFLIGFFVCLPSFSLDDNANKQKAYEYYENYQYDKALKHFLAISEESMTDEILILISNSYDSCGENILAYNTLQELIKRSPKCYQGFYNLGVLNLKNGNLDFAIECFEKALKLNKKSFEANYNLALAYSEKAEYKLAIKYFKKSLKYNDEHIDTYLNIANIYKEIGNIKKYQKYMNKYNSLI